MTMLLEMSEMREILADFGKISVSWPSQEKEKDKEEETYNLDRLKGSASSVWVIGPFHPDGRTASFAEVSFARANSDKIQQCVFR